MKMLGRFPRLKLIWADGAYAGYLISWVAAFTQSLGDWVLEIVKRSDDQKGFVVLPRRWVVERTFGWLSRYRRLLVGSLGIGDCWLALSVSATV